MGWGAFSLIILNNVGRRLLSKFCKIYYARKLIVIVREEKMWRTLGVISVGEFKVSLKYERKHLHRARETSADSPLELYIR